MFKDRTKLAPWLISFIVLLIYLSFLTKNYYWDGVSFAQTIEDAPGLNRSLFHPSHLIYNGVGYLFYKAIQMVAPIRAIAALQIVNCAASALCVFVLFHILRSALQSIYLCSCLTLLFAFSATWWKFSTDADAYVVSVLFILVTFYLVLPSRQPKPLLTAAAFSASMLFHQLAVLFLPVAVLGVFLQTESLPWKRRILTILEFGAAAFIVTGSVYCGSFHLATGGIGLRTFFSWVTYRSPDASFTFGVVHNLVHTVRGQIHLFFGGRFNLIKGLINPLIIGLMVILVALCLFLIFSLIQSVKRWSWQNLRFKIDHRNKSLVWLSLVWICAYNSFLFFWLPLNTFYRLFYLPALILLAALIISAWSSRADTPRYRLASLIAIVAISNFLFLIFPYAHAQKYPPQWLSLQMSQVWPQGTVIFYAADNSDNGLFRYMNPTTVWRPLDPEALDEVESDLEEIYRRGNTAWIEASAIDRLSSSSSGEEWLLAHAMQRTRRDLKDPAFNIKFMQIVPRASQPMSRTLIGEPLDKGGGEQIVRERVSQDAFAKSKLALSRGRVSDARRSSPIRRIQA